MSLKDGMNFLSLLDDDHSRDCQSVRGKFYHSKDTCISAALSPFFHVYGLYRDHIVSNSSVFRIDTHSIRRIPQILVARPPSSAMPAAGGAIAIFSNLFSKPDVGIDVDTAHSSINLQLR